MKWQVICIFIVLDRLEFVKHTFTVNQNFLTAPNNEFEVVIRVSDCSLFATASDLGRYSFMVLKQRDNGTVI